MNQGGWIVVIVRVFLSGLFLALATLSSAAPAGDERYIIKFSLGAEANVKGAVTTSGGKIQRSLAHRRLLAAHLPPGLVRVLQARGDIELIEVDPKRYPQNDNVPYGITMVQAHPALPEGPNGSHKVCIIDSGYDVSHEDLTGTSVTGDDDCGPGCTAGPWNEDGFGHGTHVAGTIAALQNDVGVVGVIPGGTLPLHIVRVFDNQGRWAYGSDIIAAIDQCAAAGARVVNMSLGGAAPSAAEELAFTNAFNGANLNAPGNTMLFVAAAGNGGTEGLSYPASYDSVMSVAAIDSAEQAAGFSQFNHQVEIAAPGVNVESTLPGGLYAHWDGTSMATPHVTGVAALVWGNHEACSAAQIRAALVAGAKNLGGPGRDSSYGHGLVQALAAETALNTACAVSPPPDNGYVAEDITTAPATVASANPADEYQYTVEVPAGASDLRIRMYDTVPGAGGDGDPDLYVLRPDADPAFPAANVWDCRPYINGASEECVFDNPEYGTWRVMLRAFLGFTDVDVKATFNPGTGPQTLNQSADADLPSKGTVSRTYADLEFNDGLIQTITETTSGGGKPSNRTTVLDHRWRFPNVSIGEEVTLHLVAAVTDSGEADTIEFSTSFDGGSHWVPLCLPAGSCDLPVGGALQYYPVTLPITADGTVLIRAVDTNRGRGNLNQDILYVDQMYIETYGPTGGTPPPPPPEPTPPGDLTLTANGEKRKKGLIYVDLSWSPQATVTVRRSVNGADFAVIKTIVDGTSWEDDTRLRRSQVLKYKVCRDDNDCSDEVTLIF